MAVEDSGFSKPYGPFSAEDAKKIIAEITKPKPKGTQSGHAVTNSKNYTKPLTPAQKQAEAKRPAVGNDKAVAKKVQGPSHNNGYTN